MLALDGMKDDGAMDIGALNDVGALTWKGKGFTDTKKPGKGKGKKGKGKGKGKGRAGDGPGRDRR